MRVRQVYPNGLIATIAGNGSRGYSGDGGLATQAQLNAPSAIALGNNGNLYVADRPTTPSGCSSTPATACPSAR